MIQPEKEKRPVEGIVEKIPLLMLYVDRDYQRPIKMMRVNKIVKEFNPRLLGVLIVSWRDDGLMAILDGQHRYEALKRLYKAAEQAPPVRCLVYDNLTREQEAELFDKLNSERTEVAPNYSFVARYFARDPDTVTIVETVHDCGLGLYDERLDGKGLGCMKCFALLESVYQRHGADHLHQVLSFLVECWGKKTTFTLHAVAGVSLFLEHYEDDPLYREQRAIEVISRWPYEAFINKMQGYSGGSAAGYAFALAIVNTYNLKLRSAFQLDESRITRKTAY